MKVSDARVQPIFNDALEFPPGPERDSYLAKACGKDVDLRHRVQALLRAHQLAGDFLSGGRADANPTEDR